MRSRTRNAGKNRRVLSTISSKNDWDKARPQVAGRRCRRRRSIRTGLRGPVTGFAAQAIDDLNRSSNNVRHRPTRLHSAVDSVRFPPTASFAAGRRCPRARTITFTAPKIGQLVSHASPLLRPTSRQVDRFSASPCRRNRKGSAAADPEDLPTPARTRRRFTREVSATSSLWWSTGKAGAAILPGLRSLCSGAGPDDRASPDVVQPSIGRSSSEYMTEPLASDQSGFDCSFHLASGRLERILPGRLSSRWPGSRH